MPLSPSIMMSRASAAVAPMRFTSGKSLTHRRTISAPILVLPNPRPARISQLAQSPAGATWLGRAHHGHSKRSPSASTALKRARAALTAVLIELSGTFSCVFFIQLSMRAKN